MNVNQLHKALGALIEQGHGRKPVCIAKLSFTDPLEEDGANILPVEHVTGPEWIYKTDDDGGVKINKDGSEAQTRIVILRGNEEPTP
jgi:hypothetical protein